MQLFQAPGITRFDLNFTILGFPVRVHPLFWLIAIIFGFSAANIAQVFIWVPIVFVSILFHELGHAMTMRYYGRDSRIVLHAAGGLTIPESVWWGGRVASVAPDPVEEIMISLAGPMAGFIMAAFVMVVVVAIGGSIGIAFLGGIIPFPSVILPFGGMILYLIVANLLWVNIFWGLLNIMPIYPLDGGNIARYLFLQSDPWGGTRKSLRLSAIAAVVISFVGLVLLHSIYIALLFGFLAFQSYQMMKGSVGY